jgi:hypothetical protein
MLHGVQETGRQQLADASNASRVGVSRTGFALFGKAFGDDPAAFECLIHPGVVVALQPWEVGFGDVHGAVPVREMR